MEDDPSNYEHFGIFSVCKLKEEMEFYNQYFFAKNSKLRVLIAMVAFGIGIHIPVI